MEAVYTLLDIERGVPEPWGSLYDVRALLNSAIVMRDGEKLKLPAPLEALIYISPALKIWRRPKSVSCCGTTG